MTPPPEDRCPITELLVSQCGCPQHRGGEMIPADFEEDRRTTPKTEGDDWRPTWHEAEFGGVCQHCDTHYRRGDLVGHSYKLDAWVAKGCCGENA